MDLIIVDQNINYTKSLREFFLGTSKFKNIIVFRTLKELLISIVPQRGILLFELNEINEDKIKEITSLNKNLMIIALSDDVNINDNLSLVQRGISSIISKNEKPNIILEQIDLVIKGKRILPKDVVENLIVSTNKFENQKQLSKIQKISKSISKIFL